MNSDDLPAEQKRKIDALIVQRFHQDSNELSLQGCRYDWEAVLLSKDWTTLRSLRLNSCEIHDDNIQVLTNLKWPMLQKLQLSNNQITADGMKLLLNGHLPKLKGLWLNENTLGDAGLSLLCATDSLPELQRLIIAKNYIKSTGIAMLLDSKLTQLKQLRLSGNYDIRRTGAQLLTKISFNTLQKLYRCFIGNEGAKELGKGLWPNLQQLNLEDNFIGFDGYATIYSNNWRGLKFIWVRSYDKTDPSIVLNLIPINSKIDINIFFTIRNPEINQTIKQVLYRRFCS